MKSLSPLKTFSAHDLSISTVWVQVRGGLVLARVPARQAGRNECCKTQTDRSLWVCRPCDASGGAGRMLLVAVAMVSASGAVTSAEADSIDTVGLDSARLRLKLGLQSAGQSC